MKTVELFSGTCSFSKIANKNGHKIFCVENDTTFKADLYADIEKISPNQLPKDIDILWASPPCTAFSVASMGRNWDKETRAPKTITALTGIRLLKSTIWLIQQTKPKIWFIENPRGMMRKIIDTEFEKFGITGYIRHTITYCQYGDTRMKPTDIWTNCKAWKPKKPCNNGDNCHISAPRGSKTGTQGLKNAKIRSIIPPALFEEIFISIEDTFNKD